MQPSNFFNPYFIIKLIKRAIFLNIMKQRKLEYIFFNRHKMINVKKYQNNEFKSEKVNFTIRPVNFRLYFGKIGSIIGFFGVQIVPSLTGFSFANKAFLGLSKNSNFQQNMTQIPLFSPHLMTLIFKSPKL